MKVCWKYLEVSGRGIRVSGRAVSMFKSLPVCLKVAGKGLESVWKGWKVVKIT